MEEALYTFQKSYIVTNVEGSAMLIGKLQYRSSFKMPPTPLTLWYGSTDISAQESSAVFLLPNISNQTYIF